MKEKVVVLGAGESGVGAALLAQKQGFSVFVCPQAQTDDSHAVRKRFIEISPLGYG